MKCVHCNSTFYADVELNAWDACPICSKRMLGFKDDALDFGVEVLLQDVKAIEKKLYLFRERLRQNRSDQDET